MIHVDESVKIKLQEKNAVKFELVTQYETSVQAYRMKGDRDEDQAKLEQGSHFFKVSSHNEDYFIRKQTAVWLLQEPERLSSDRLFRVRAKMPCEAKSPSKVSPICTVSSQPIKAEYLVVGDLCAFKTLTTTPQFKIGKVLQFILFDKEGKKLSYKCWESIMICNILTVSYCLLINNLQYTYCILLFID